MLVDVINFAGTLSVRKLWNILIVHLSFTLSSLLRKPIVWGLPWFVSIEPSSVCNLSCPQCPVGAGDIARGNKFISPSDFENILSEISATTAVLSLYFQGEPLMHKQFAGLINRATTHNVYSQTSTNGQLLTEEVCREMVDAGLDRIIVSLDGVDQDSYQAYRRGGELKKVEDGIRTLHRIRQEKGSRKPFIIIQFLVFRHNQDQIPEVKRLGRELGADRVWIKSAQVEYPESAENWIPVDEDSDYDKISGHSVSGKKSDSNPYSRYEKSPSGEWRLRGKLLNRCKRLWQTTVITSDALVVPCCFDKSASFTMGDMGEENFKRIWKSREYQKFRKQILSNRKEVAMCTNCTEGIAKIYR